MADFRKALYTFASGALFIGLAVSANAQSSPTCSVTAVPTTVRAEAYTDLQGDVVLTCVGGIPTAATQPVPAITFTINTQGIITSKITDATPSLVTNPTAFTEALLIIDDPNRFKAVATPGNPILACGDPTAPYDGGGTNLGVCTITADGTGGGAAAAGAVAAGNTYNGTAGHPNVFQGRVLPNSGGTGIQFIGVPFDPPAAGETLTIRITNIRINAVGLSGGNLTGTGFGVGQVFSQVAITTPTSVSVASTQVQTALIRNGLLYPPTAVTVGPYPQCGPIPTSGGSISVTEGFPSSFKTKNWAQHQPGTGNGINNGTNTDLLYNGTNLYPADLNQNVPGTLYSTESGFEFIGTPATTDPVPNAPLGRVGQGQALATSVLFPTGLQTGINLAGSVSNGTRLVFVFSNVPVGSVATVPTKILLRNAQTGSGNPTTGAMLAVTGFDANGAGGSISTGIGTISLSETANTTVIYEVIFDDKDTIETATVPVTIAPIINLGANPPVNGTPQINVIAQGQAGFAPFYAQNFAPNPGITEPLSATTTATSLPIARFINNLSDPLNLFSFTKCSCDLLFPWVVGDSTFTTSIVVDNTSLDPGKAPSSPLSTVFTAAPQTGHVRFWYYGTKGTSATSGIEVAGNTTNYLPTSQVTTVLTPAGSYVAHVISPSAAGDTATNGLVHQASNFAGYVIAQSEFRYCHGIAAISSSVPGFGTQTYVGLVMDNGTQLPARTSNLGENFGN